MKKRIILSLFILCVATGCGKVPKLANGEEAVVSFDNEKLSISATDLYNELKDKYALNILVDLIDKKILQEEYPDSEKDASESAKKELTAIKEYYVDEDGKYDEAALLNALASYYGISSIEDFEKMLELSYYRNKAVEDYTKAQITDKEIDKYYKDEIVGDISASHILITPDTTDKMTDDEVKAAEAAALKEAKSIIKKLNEGEDFAELAKKYSDDESNAEKGGDLDYFNKDKMEAPFEKAAYALKLNKYTTEPVKTTYGYHIILKTGEKDKAALKDVKDIIVEKLAAELKSKDSTLQINALVDLRKSYGIKIEDSNINSKYSTYISNQLLSAQSSS